MTLLIILMYYASLALCVFMLVGCVCRVRLMSCRRTGMMWILLHTLLVAVAVRLGLDLLFTGQSDWLFGLVVLAGNAYLVATWRLWANEPPPYTNKGFTWASYRQGVIDEYLKGGKE